MWPLLALSAGGAVLGYENQKYKQEQQKQNMLANAEALRYSPWTRMNPGMMKADVGSPMMGIAQGALSGAMMGSQFGGAAPTAAPVAAAAASPTPDSSLEAGGGFAPGSFATERARLGSPATTPELGLNAMPVQNRWAGMRQNQPNFYQTGSPWGAMSSNYGMG